MLLAEIAATSAAVGETPARLAKIERLAACLRRLAPGEVGVAVAYLSGEIPRGALGVGWASLRSLPGPSPPPGTVDLLEADASLARVQAATGPGSQAKRRAELTDLFGRLTEGEQRFAVALLSGELRQGALGGVMVEAVARAGGIAVADLRRALLVSGDLSAVASAVIAAGATGLSEFRLTLLRPLRPMLAQTAAGPEEALQRICPAGVEWKLDGVRVQVHRSGDEVAIFTRNLADVTGRVPEIVEAIRVLPGGSLVLDGELIGLLPGGRPRRFQETMARFASLLPTATAREPVPLSPFFFDALHLGGDDLIDRPAAERHAALASVLPARVLVPRTVAFDAAAAAAFLDTAIEAGHEGIMVKALDAPYEAGRRGSGWLKVKRAHTLDLVVLAAEWGHGRRRGWLSNLHLGARDPVTGGFVMLGKTFKGMTDQMLDWQTERLQALETSRDAYTVYVRPELVVEVALDGVQDSRRYPGGLALRFARIKGYRPDKSPDEADTMDAVRAIRGDG